MKKPKHDDMIHPNRYEKAGSCIKPCRAITDKMRLDWMVKNQIRWVDGNGSKGSTVPIVRAAIDAAIRREKGK